MNMPSPGEIRILLVEDTPSDADLAKREISRELKNCVFRCVETSETFLAALTDFLPDLIISDYNLPRFNGLTALRLAQEHAPLTPLIILTGSMNEDTAVSCMKAGASNYVIKEQIKRLGQSVIRALEEARLRRENHAAAQALIRNERYFRSLIENAQDLITVIDARGMIHYQSPSVQRVLGYPVTEFVNHNVFDFIHPEDRQRCYEAFQRTVSNTQRADNIEYRIRHANGSWRFIESVGKRLVGEEPPSVVVNSRDVTESQRIEAQLRQAQKMEAIGQLSSGVAHDFNNILTTIMGNASLLRHEEDLPDEHVELTNEILEAAERASGLTRQLLLFSRKQAFQLVDLDLNEAVRQMLKMLQRILGEDIALEVDCPGELPSIRGDVGMIDQVILNLAVNARDAMPGGGRLKIQTLTCSNHEEKGTSSRTKFVCLKISDTGCGISPDHLSHIFEPFFTTKEAGKGTGLGLATVYGIVQQHNGTIDVTSELGQGTTFQITFPAIDSAGQSRPAAVTQSVRRTNNELILVVEDELPVCLVVSKLLQLSGYRVLTAQSGPEALLVWSEHKRDIHLMLTDLVMPDGMTGRELARQLRADAPQLRVIYSSGYSPELAGRNLHREPGTRFLQKPYAIDSLARTVRECLDEFIPAPTQ